jgi:predicted metal-dependent phosphoesterase TrpH
LDTLISQLAQAGLKGLEAYYVDNSRMDTGNLLRIAIKYNLVSTGGSDYHGSYKPDIELGIGYGDLKVPIDCYEKLADVLEI